MYIEESKKTLKIQILCVESHTKVLRYIVSCGGKFLKLILTYLYFIKYNEINIYYLDVQKPVSHEKYYK